MLADHHRPGTLRFFAVLSACLSALMLYSFATYDGIPDRSLLTTAGGRIAWVEHTRHVITFKFEGDDASYAYLSSNGAMGAADSALEREATVTVRYAPRLESDNGDATRDVLEVEAGGHVMRSHAEIAASRASNRRIGGGLGIAFALSSLYLWRRSRRSARRDAPLIRLSR